ncbi:hypothetical protein KCG43_00980 [Photobacterium sp. WH24]|uniref:hypothetical protein n=1 Tax=Photobacterium sp. WH24 TaxID=2827237 RepID=UPI001C45770C|nr:hypothetical protein [Photobacterium sp. WH24]MBV7260590.1 hypothetical protein [Photobacterium sp. WH24]
MLVNKPCVFYLGSDTLVYLFKNVLLEMLELNDIYVSFPIVKDEGAKEAFLKLFPGKSSRIKNPVEIFFKLKNKNAAFIVGNDWGAEVKLLIKLARKLNIVSVALQESVVDLSNTSNRYLFSDMVFAQGIISKELMRRSNVEITGNPRYESLSYHHGNTNGALINCNFTYGIFEDVRDDWIKSVSHALKNTRVEFKISKHPRDFSNLEGLENYVIPSHAGVVHKQVINSKFLITRFSSLIHEALLLGRPVIYYNPHNENMGYEFKPDGIVLIEAKNQEELENAICHINTYDFQVSDFQNYISPHLANSYSISEPPSSVVVKKILSLKHSYAGQAEIQVIREMYILLKEFIYKKLKVKK